MAPKLTPEEKKLLKQKKKEEKKRLAELKKRQLQHDLVSREVKYGKLTLKLHEKNWRKMLIDIALPRMRVDVAFAWHNFERVIDAKDFTISLLMDEIRDAEEQYMLNLRCHAENVDNLVIRFGDRLKELKENSEAEIASLQTYAEKEVDETQKTASDSEEYLKTMLYGLEMARIEQEKLVRGDYLSKIDEETNRYNDILQNLRAGLEYRSTHIWDQTKSFIKHYTAEKAERKKAYLVIAAQDEALTKLCSDQRIKLFKMQETIKKLKLKFINSQEIQGAKINDLLEERAYFAETFTILKDKFDADRTKDDNSLATMTVLSNEIMEYLQKKRKKGQQLLSLSAVCRKFETQEEKILPFPLPDCETSNHLEIHNDIKLSEYRNTAALYLFWQRVAQADAIRYSINEEREALKRENRILKSKIHNYCQCLDCPAFDNNNVSDKKSENINVVDGYSVQRNYSKY